MTGAGASEAGHRRTDGQWSSVHETFPALFA